MNILIVEKTGVIKEAKVSDPADVFKKCGFKTPKEFEHQTTWTVDCCNEAVNIKLYAKTTGRANSENKYEFPPPVDSDLYFGSVALLAFSMDDEILDLYTETWEKVYEDLYGGFEDLGGSDSDETDELDDVPAEMKTKEGYLKDGFVVPDELILDEIDCDAAVGEGGDGDEEMDGREFSDEDSGDDSGGESDLSEEKYYYSDDEN